MTTTTTPTTAKGSNATKKSPKPKASAAKKTAKQSPAPRSPSATAKETSGPAAPKVSPAKSGLTDREIKVLAALDAGKDLTRAGLVKATGIAKGWSKLLGAATKKSFGGGKEGLEPRGLVKSAKDSRPLEYAITDAGRKALSSAKSGE